MRWREVLDNSENKQAICVASLMYLFSMGLALWIEFEGAFEAGIVTGTFFAVLSTLIVAKNKLCTLPLAIFIPLAFLFGLAYLFELSLPIGIIGVIGIFVIAEIVFFLDKEKPKKFRMAWINKETGKEIGFGERFNLWLEEEPTKKSSLNATTQKKSWWKGFMDWLEDEEDDFY